LKAFTPSGPKAFKLVDNCLILVPDCLSEDINLFKFILPVFTFVAYSRAIFSYIASFLACCNFGLIPKFDPDIEVAIA
jgi:hypothetical protein